MGPLFLWQAGNLIGHMRTLVARKFGAAPRESQKRIVATQPHTPSSRVANHSCPNQPHQQPS